MEQSKAMEYESRKASSDVLKPRNIYSLGTPIANRNSVPYLYCRYPRTAMEN